MYSDEGMTLLQRSPNVGCLSGHYIAARKGDKLLHCGITSMSQGNLWTRASVFNSQSCMACSLDSSECLQTRFRMLEFTVRWTSRPLTTVSSASSCAAFASASAENIKKFKLPDGEFLHNMLQQQKAIVNAMAINDDGVMVSGVGCNEEGGAV